MATHLVENNPLVQVGKLPPGFPKLRRNIADLSPTALQTLLESYGLAVPSAKSDRREAFEQYIGIE